MNEILRRRRGLLEIQKDSKFWIFKSGSGVTVPSGISAHGINAYQTGDTLSVSTTTDYIQFATNSRINYNAIKSQSTNNPIIGKNGKTLHVICTSKAADLRAGSSQLLVYVSDSITDSSTMPTDITDVETCYPNNTHEYKTLPDNNTNEYQFELTIPITSNSVYVSFVYWKKSVWYDYGRITEAWIE